MSEDKAVNQAIQSKQAVGPSDPIEPVVWPMDPGIDWTAVWTLLGWGGVLVALLAGWWLWRTRFARSARWQRQARSVKTQWQKRPSELSDGNVTETMRWQLYALFQSAPLADAKIDDQNDTTQRNRMQILCFSTQPVSRETLLSELSQLMQDVDQAARLKANQTVSHAWHQAGQTFRQRLFQRRQT
jgi:hypothetical protein